MARRLRDSSGAVVAIEMSGAEMAHSLAVSVEDLELWSKTIPAHSGRGENATYRIKNVAQLQLLKKRASLLASRMNETAVRNVEKAGLLDAYAALAADCPAHDGITVHVWRSYGLVVLMQVRYGKMIDAEELAQRAGLTEPNPLTGKAQPSVEMARKHLRLLQAKGYLKVGTDKWTGQWEHKGLPESWRGA